MLARHPIRRAILGLAALAGANTATISAQAQLLRDVEIENYLDDNVRPIYRAAGLPADNIKILIVGDNSPNAFAGGLTTGITTGLIVAADTPNQINGVMAHEAGHILGGHTARSDEAISAATRPILLSLVLAAGAIAAGAPEAGIGLLGLGQNVALANYLTYSRSQESAADQAAVTVLDKMGQSSVGLLEFFGKLRNNQLLTNRRINPYLQSHPLANQRITALEERVRSSPYSGVRDSEEEIFRLRMIQAKIKGFLQEAHVTLRQYPVSDVSKPARYARAVAYYRAADIDRAGREIDSLLAEEPDNPFFHELKGQMLFEFGRVREAIAPHRRSVELMPNKALLKINLGRALLAVEEPDSLRLAAEELKSALLLEPDNSFGWFELARAYGGLGQEPLADLATAESRYHVGDKVAANRFARRALQRLPKNTPEWRQASDVIAATSGDNAPRVRGARRPSPDTLPPSPDDDSEPETPQSEAPAPTEPEPSRPQQVPDPS